MLLPLRGDEMGGRITQGAALGRKRLPLRGVALFAYYFLYFTHNCLILPFSLCFRF